MDSFKEIINTYVKNYSSYKNGTLEFECDFGELSFYKEKNTYNTIILHSIYIFPENRNKGFCRDILRYIIDKCNEEFSYLCVQSVISKVLYSYLYRFTYKNKKFKNTKQGFLYKIK